MKTTILSVLALAAVSTSVMAQDFCSQLNQLEAGVKTCTDNVVLSNRDFRNLQDVIQQNDRQIRGPRANQERAEQLNACQSGNAKLQAAIAGSNAALDGARRSVTDITAKKSELSRFISQNMPSSFECVAIDPKYGNSPDQTGQPNVFYGSGRTEADAINNMYAVAASRGNTAVNRLKRSYKCFEVLNREAAQRFEGDIRALSNAANQVTYNAAVINVEIGGSTGGGRDGGGRDGGGRDGGGREGGGREGGGRQGGGQGGGRGGNG